MHPPFLSGWSPFSCFLPVNILVLSEEIILTHKNHLPILNPILNTLQSNKQ